VLSNILIYLLVIVEAITSILLIGLILLQKPKNYGAGLAFGSGMGESLFGSQVGNVLTRTTVILATVFLLNTAVLAIVVGRRHRSPSLTDRVRTTQPAARPAPMAPAAQPMPAPEADLPAAPVAVGTPGPVEGLAQPAAAPVALPPPADGGAEQPAPVPAPAPGGGQPASP
jgi:preprotein translocase subunit SecG